MPGLVSARLPQKREPVQRTDPPSRTPPAGERFRTPPVPRNIRWSIVLFLANFLPVALIYWFVHRFGADFPLLDEWDTLVIPLQEFNRGTLTLSALFAQHNEHREVFPRLLTLANAVLFHWNRTAEMYVTATLLVICAWLLYRFARNFWGSPLAPLLFVPVAWTVLSWRQWENLLWGTQTCEALFVAGAVVAFLLLQRSRTIDKYVSGAAIAAFVATFSLAGGVFLWPVGLAQLLLLRWRGVPGRRPSVGSFIAWAAAGIFTCALFFYQYGMGAPSWPTGFAYVIRNPLTAVRYFVTVIGSPLSVEHTTAQTMGLMIAFLGAWAVFRLHRDREELIAAAPLLALIALTVLSALISCDRRMGLGVEQAMSSRYCTLTNLGLVALYLLLVRFALTRRSTETLLTCGGMTAFLLFGTIINLISNYQPERLDWYRVADYAVRYADLVSDDVLRPIYPDPNVVRQRAPFLRAHGYSLFHVAVPNHLPRNYRGVTPGCVVDSVNGRSGVQIDINRRVDASGLTVTGWAVDIEAKGTPARVLVSIDGQIDIPALSGQPRPDVARVFGVPGYTAAGFTSYIRTSLIPAGEHLLQLKLINHDGTEYWICGNTQLRVSD